MITSFFRIVKYGIQNFWRNGWLSVATILVLVLAILVFQSLFLFGAFSNAAVASIQDKIDISVTFKTTTSEDDILSLERSLEDLTHVKAVQYISRDEAFELFKEEHKDDQVIAQALDLVDGNPLLASLNIKAERLEDYSSIASYLGTENFASLIEKVTYYQSQNAIERLDSIIGTFQRIGLGVAIFLAFAAALVTFNTIRLAIYSNRDEISIMRLVGASNLFIRGPYVIEGIIYGVVAGIVGMLISLPFIFTIAPYTDVLVPEFSLQGYFSATLLPLLTYLILFGIVLGTASSYIAVRRYLKA
ncbi:MAG: hypothetical protein COU08_03610 [Candidatus Harrisonbacteria bacterium CG10_big_fil_rev_8_21_14_0_10_42_17]|uniref:Cell division protein FtsX n=1 Tax=Candidatus Harrisonbacteria bacterium CG10_big_fil_rev_8_21_14_0_10_42_17 TaxID=1974584 RepID=A0A2M6WHG6_9BACT|nr:MAG: hypothetical protein COU08_03610 [Candidatus Harrisonbacteria bacterium CG10_big_fil_rev_8_21_14_0_10_42_17]